MTPDAITGWLNSPSSLSEDAPIETMVREWPWFVPARLLEAVKAHQQLPFSDAALARIRLYGGNWLLAYSMLTDKEDFSNQSAATEIPEQKQEDFAVAQAMPEEEQADEPLLIQPLYTEDYFRHQGIENKAPEPVSAGPEPVVAAKPQTLMVVMSFAEWLTHFKTKSQKEQEEEQEKSALRSMWQQEKLAAALDDDPQEIPEDVFEMAVSSITREDDIASESLAQIYERQEKWSAAAEMYRKLALKYPAKSTYFATRAESARKRLL